MPFIELDDGTVLPILYEDRSVIAIDKPAGWMLAPFNWTRTSRNLHLAISSSIAAGAFWARSRHVTYLRHVHRLDAETGGVLLLARSPGALRTYGRLFESRRMEKRYLAVVRGVPTARTWTCRLKVAPDPKHIGRMRIDSRRGREAETRFTVLERGEGKALVEARPVTGRTHQIRLHLASAGLPVIGDPLYGRGADPDPVPLALRAVALSYLDPFRKRRVVIEAPVGDFCARHGFAADGSGLNKCISVRRHGAFGST